MIIYDGAELGSTGLKMNWSHPDLSWVNAKNTTSANNNCAPSGYVAIAA